MSRGRSATTVARRVAVPRARRAAERGVALLSVLGILAVLLVIGSLVASSSRMETALSGSGKQSARAFNAADAGLGVALGEAANFTQLGCRDTNLEDAGLAIIGTVRVCYRFEGPPPPSIKVSALKFKAFHFDMDAVGNSPPTGVANLEMEAARLGPAS